jgi:putative nucleotidyltransferase with HDIG domain
MFSGKPWALGARIRIDPMNNPLKVFLCSTVLDLSDERERVLDAIRRLQFQHHSMEFFGARTDQPIESCFAEVRESDVLVVIVGLRYGNLVPGLGVSFSEAEYREGHRLGKECLVYIRDENVPILPKHIERDPQKMVLLEDWKHTLRERHTVVVFKDGERLSVQVTADLSSVARVFDRKKSSEPAARHAEISEAIKTTETVRQTMAALRATYDSSSEILRQNLIDLERSYDITLEALGDALDLKNAETEGHSKRVTAFTIAIARAMGLPHDNIRVIARGAFLHDIGKMAIPDAILRKPGRLNPEEQEIMRHHAQLGYQILHRIPFLREAADIVYSHQECFDGSGYPRGLKGDQIPLGARIFAIADSFDAITSDWPYRAAQSIPAGRREIERNSGRQFDPEIVQVFLSIPDHIWQELRNEIGVPTPE